ncbi:MAG: hypothetical protein WCI01_12005 [Chlorobiaceae bacterium]
MAISLDGIELENASTNILRVFDIFRRKTADDAAILRKRFLFFRHVSTRKTGYFCAIEEITQQAGLRMKFL